MREIEEENQTRDQLIKNCNVMITGPVDYALHVILPHLAYT